LVGVRRAYVTIRDGAALRMTTHPDRTIFCPRCMKERRASWRQCTEEHEGLGVKVSVEDTHYLCGSCGEELDDPDVPDSMVPIYDAYRRAARTLSPDEVREIRERTGLSQVAFATLLGMSPATINMYEHGSPIAVKEDCLLRLAAFPGAIDMLMRVRGGRLRPGQIPAGWVPGARPGEPPRPR